MRTSWAAVGLTLTVTFCAISSEAATLPFNGTLSVTISSLVPVTTTGSGTGTSAGLGLAADIPANVFALNQSFVLSPPLLGLFPDYAVCAQAIPDRTTFKIRRTQPVQLPAKMPRSTSRARQGSALSLAACILPTLTSSP